jgi:putative hydrolase of the HAD superfamily
MEWLLIFDGDDTLWSTEALYDAARADARTVVEVAGVNGELWEAIERKRDVANVARFGMSAQRFPTSCVEAFDCLGGTDSEVRAAVWAAASQVFSRPAPLIKGALDVLETLASTHRLALLTKGDPDVQQRRIEESGLRAFFDALFITAEKSAAVFARTASDCGVKPARSVSIGNSLRSDVIPALEAGMHAVWIDAHVWEWERHRTEDTNVPQGVIVADSLLQVPAVLKGEPTWV